MPDVLASDRAALDSYIQILSRYSDDVGLDDFRTAAMAAALRSSRRVRVFVVVGGLLFLFLSLSDLGAQALLLNAPPWAAMISAAVWSFALGGIGVIASIFVHLLRLMPQHAINATDEFDVFGRVILGCLFSTIISITVVPNIFSFFCALERLTLTNMAATGPLSLLPFLLGYSIPLALRILEKIMLAVEIAIGADDRRPPTSPRGRRGRRQ